MLLEVRGFVRRHAARHVALRRLQFGVAFARRHSPPPPPEPPSPPPPPPPSPTAIRAAGRISASVARSHAASAAPPMDGDGAEVPWSESARNVTGQTLERGENAFQRARLARPHHFGRQAHADGDFARLQPFHQDEVENFAVRRADLGQAARHQVAAFVGVGFVERLREQVAERFVAGVVAPRPHVVVGDVAGHAVDERDQPGRLAKLAAAKRLEHLDHGVLRQVAGRVRRRGFSPASSRAGEGSGIRRAGLPPPGRPGQRARPARSTSSPSVLCIPHARAGLV